MQFKKLLPVIKIEKNYWLISSSCGKYSIFDYHSSRERFDYFAITFDGMKFDHESLYSPYLWLGSQVRKLFPTAYWIGLQDCDSGGHVTNSFNILAYNYFHLKKLEKQINGMGDGEIWQRISVYQYFKSKFLNWKHRHDSY